MAKEEKANLIEPNSIQLTILENMPRGRHLRRNALAFWAFLGFFNLYALRVTLSLAIVAMTTSTYKINGKGLVTEVPAEFDWDSKVQGTILSSFFYGYLVTQLPAGYFGAKFGGRKMFGLGVGLAGVITLLTPLFAKVNVYLFVTSRVAIGMLQGVAYPAMHAIWSRWAPPLERTRLSTYAFSGSYFGTVFAFSGSGLLAANFGWESIFIAFGLLACIWSIFWFYKVADCPASDPEITDLELEFITKSLGSAATNVKNLGIPTRKILTSAPVWAIVIAHFCENWGFYTLLTELPTFMSDIYNLKFEYGGSISALPYVFMGIMVSVSGAVADYIRTGKNLSTVKTRKVCNTVGFLMQALFLVIAANTSYSVMLMVALCFGIGFGGVAWSGFGVNHLDIAPAYAALLMGVSNTVATLPGMVSPIITGYLVTNKSREEWNIVFYIAAAFYIAGAAFYALFASGVEQPWARLDTGLLRKEDSTSEDEASSTENLAN